jgi:hypothetical protein
MKKVIFLSFVIGVSVFFNSSCNKNKCHECHYDNASGNMIELGEKCGDDIENLEANGYTDTTGTYEVHCHGH